jgi:PAS domain S-box-containing protein
VTGRGFAFSGSLDGARVLRWQIRTLLVAILLVAVASFLPLESVQLPLVSYVPFHTGLEFLSVLISFLVFATVWFTPARDTTAPLTVISLAILGGGVLDTLHLLSIVGMPDFVTPSSTQKSVAFWLAARACVAVGLLVGGVLQRTTPLSYMARRYLVGGVVLYVAGVTFVTLLHASSLPLFFRPDIGTTSLKLYSEILLVGVLSVTAWLFYKSADASDESYYALMFGAVAIATLGESFFAKYTAANDVQNLLGHLFKIYAYWLIFKAMFILSVRKPYEQLAQQTKRLIAANESLRVQSLALDSAATPVMVTDIQGVVKWRNRASIALKPSVLIGQSSLFDNFLTPDSAVAIQMQSRLRVGEVWRGRVRIMTDHDHEVYLDRVVTPVRNDDGYVEGFVSVSENVTSQVVAQETHRRALQTALDGYFLSDANGKILEVNDAYIQMSGYTESELLTMSVHDLLPESDRDIVDTNLRNLIAQGNGRFKSRHRRKDGEELIVNVSVSYDRSTQRHYAFIHDCTEQDHQKNVQESLERQLQHAQKMHAFGLMTSGISHDFNNILSSILGYSSLAITRFAQDKESKLHAYLREIVSASERARDLIVKMQTYTRTQSEDHVAAVSPADVVREVEAMLRPSMPASIQLRSTIESEQRVRMNSGDLHQILVNLVINARDAITSQGRVTIRVQEASLHDELCAITQQRLSGRFLMLEVVDNGSGIPQENRNRLFDPFFTTKDVGKGSGLGLSMVQGLLRKAQAHLVLKSEPSSGSRFQVLFPLLPLQEAVKPADQGPATPSRPEAPGSGELVWVVDDENAVAGFLSELLGDAGFEVRVFNSPLTALSVFRAEAKKPALLISDQTMPGLTGVQLASLMHDIWRELPVIICTGFSDGIPTEDLELAGISKVFIKPVSPDALIDAMSALLVDSRVRTVH